MLRSVLALMLVCALAGEVSAQSLAGGSITANGQSVSVTLRGDPDVRNVAMQVTGTWTGTLTFQGSVDGSTFVSVLVALASTGATATSTTSNGVFTLANSGYRVVRVTATAAMTGTAVVTLNEGYAGGGGAGSGGGDASAANQTTIIGHVDTLETLLAAIETATEATEVATEALQTSAAASTLERYISVGTTEDENEIKATPGTLDGISAYNNHATAAAFLKCTNLTAANTTPGTSAIFYSMIIPPVSGFVDNNITATFSVALTCYIVLGEADTDVAEVAANDVGYNIRYR